MTIDLIILTLVLFNAVSITLQRRSDATASKRQVQELESQSSSYKADLRDTTSHLRLAKSDITRLEGKVAGLEIELEAAQKEAHHWEEIAKHRKRILEQHNITHG